VSHADVHIDNIKADALTFAEVEIDLRGVELDRSRLFNDRKARINGISHGTVTAVVTQEALSDVLHQKVLMADGQISVTVAGRSIPLTPFVAASGRLTLNGQGLTKPFRLVIPSTAFVPCVGDVTVLAGRMKLSCPITKVPPALLDVVQDQPV
jgi:hypothetical protein